jgi:hypothetical protein
VDRHGADLLVLAGRKTSGRFAVRDGLGGLTAQISVPWHGSSFTVTRPDGTVLCAAALGKYGFSSTWKVTGGDGRELLTTRWRWTGSTAWITLDRGDKLLLRTRWWKEGFTLVDANGVEVVRAAPATRRRSIRRRDCVVRQVEPTLDLAELVAVMQIWRMNDEDVVA